MKQPIPSEYIEFTELDNLSNSVLDLIKAKKFDEAEAACHKLSEQYPDMVDGIERLALVYEARGEKEKAIDHYLKAVAFMKRTSGFSKEAIEWILNHIEQLK